MWDEANVELIQLAIEEEATDVDPLSLFQHGSVWDEPEPISRLGRDTVLDQRPRRDTVPNVRPRRDTMPNGRFRRETAPMPRSLITYLSAMMRGVTARG